MRVWNEDVVAELILPRDQVFLLALSLGDLIMTLGKAPENSLKPKSIITLLFGGHQGVTQLLTARQSDF